MVAIFMMGVGDARSQTMGLRLPLTLFSLHKSSLELGRASPGLQPSPVLDAHPGTDIWQPSGSSGLVLVCVDLGPSLHDAFQGSGIKTPQGRSQLKLTGHCGTTSRPSMLIELCSTFFVTARHHCYFSRARQSCFADVERKVSSHASRYKLPVQGAATADHVE